MSKLTTIGADVIPAAITIATAATGQPAHTLVPATRPKRFTQITRTGGVPPDHLQDQALLSIDSWGATETQAGDDARAVQAAFLAARHTTVDGVQFYAVRVVGGPAYFRDPVSHAERYRQLIAVHTRGIPYP